MMFREFTPQNICCIERADSRDRGPSTGNKGGGSSGGSGGSHGGGSGAYNGQGRPNPAPTTGYGAPIHTVQSPVHPTYNGIQVAKDPQHYAALQDQVNTYNRAATGWNNSANQRSLANLVNGIAPMGFSMQPPEFNRPSTYTGGDYHLGVNPGAFAGGLLGFAMPAAGSVAGPVLGGLYSAAGGKNLMLGGSSAPQSWAMNTPPTPQGGSQMAAGPQTPGGPGAGQQDPAQRLGQLASINSNIPGNPGAPVSSAGSPPVAPQNPQGLDFLSRMGRIQSVTPGYGVPLPSYRYTGRAGGATV